MKKLLKYKQHILVVLVIILSIGLAVGIACGIYYATCRDSALGVAILTMVAAAYGGLLTLGGVAWTIRKGDRDRQEDLRRRDAERKEEARKQFVPYIKMAYGDPIRGSVDSAVHSTLQLNDLSKQYFYSFTIKNFYIKNISNTNIILLGVFINDNYFEFKNDKLVEKDTACEIKTTKNWEYASSEPLQKLIMIIGDMLGNRYEIECSFSYKTLNSLIECTDDGKEYTGLRSDYTVTSVSLPKFIQEENR